jgi:hypothetical protein
MFSKKVKPVKKFNPYETLRRRVMSNPNPTEKDWVRLSYEDKMDWINKFGRILQF